MFAARHIPYKQTKAFTKIVVDYLDNAEPLRPFYSFPPDIAGIRAVIEQRKQQPVNREILTEVLKEQYKSVRVSDRVAENLDALGEDNTFTVCTAHQPNLFTGPLYFVYKVLHAIRLAEVLQRELPDYRFVPVYYMGSEDADFAELNHTYVHGKKIEWKKEQRGAVGRMMVDKTLLQLVDELEGQLQHEAYGKDVISLLRKCYSSGKNIQTATFELVNELYGQWGLIVLIPDNASLKGLVTEVFRSDLFDNTSSEIVDSASKRLSAHYNVQAHPRNINLFYLKDNIRERLVREGDQFKVVNTDISFTDAEILAELKTNPERFSPNVILRGLFQEMMLPNIAFIGGGGELAYWLQLKDLFQHYDVSFPVLLLRNSFLIVDEKQMQLVQKLGLSIEELFNSELDIINLILEKLGKRPMLNGQVDQLRNVYESLKQTASAVDVTLKQHVTALEARAVQQLVNLEKKLVRAERKKHEAVQRQVAKLRAQLFPNNGLQERVENFSGYYARWGRSFIEELYRHSLGLEQKFTIMHRND